MATTERIKVLLIEDNPPDADLIKELLEEVENPQYQVIHANRLSGGLEAIAGDLGVSGNVIFAGTVPHRDLPAVYRSADVFVTLSDRTNMFNPLFEAMLSGTPVVALNTGSTGEVVEDGKTGVLLGMEDLPALPGIILGVLSDEARARALAAGGRARADEITPTVEERQAQEVEIVERAVREARSRRTQRT